MARTSYPMVVIAAATALAAACANGLSPRDAPADMRSTLVDMTTVDLTTADPTMADLAPEPCLLQYNIEAPLTLSNGQQTTVSECCYRMGGVNTCDLKATCSAAAGASCCIVYATTATPVGMGCCAYEHGDDGVDPKDAAACTMLLSAGR